MAIVVHICNNAIERTGQKNSKANVISIAWTDENNNNYGGVLFLHRGVSTFDDFKKKDILSVSEICDQIY